MAERVTLRVNLRGYLKRQGKIWSAGCPSIQVFSQGSTKDAARRCLQEAIELWFDSCVERGTLDQALREVGFAPVTWTKGLTPEGESVIVSREAEDEELLGSPFNLSIDVPAYQAAAFLQRESHA